MKKISTAQFIYCCPDVFSKKYRAFIKELKKDNGEIIELTEEYVKNYYTILYGKRSVNSRYCCSKCRDISDTDGTKVTITFTLN